MNILKNGKKIKYKRFWYWWCFKNIMQWYNIFGNNPIDYNKLILNLTLFSCDVIDSNLRYNNNMKIEKYIGQIDSINLL